jgi:hypothetical protein
MKDMKAQNICKFLDSTRIDLHYQSIHHITEAILQDFVHMLYRSTVMVYRGLRRKSAHVARTLRIVQNIMCVLNNIEFH